MNKKNYPADHIVQRCIDQGVSYDEFCEAYGFTRKEAFRRLGELRRQGRVTGYLRNNIKKTDLGRLAEMVMQGCYAVEIAEELGVDDQTVRRLCREHKLPLVADVPGPTSPITAAEAARYVAKGLTVHEVALLKDMSRKAVSCRFVNLRKSGAINGYLARSRTAA